MVEAIYTDEIMTTVLNMDLRRYNSVSGKLSLPVNLSLYERLASVIIGSNLVFRGFKNFIPNPFRHSVMTAAGCYLIYRGFTGNCFLYSSVDKEVKYDRTSNINIRTSVSVNKPRQEVYAFWRNLENLPLFMSHLKRVTKQDNKHSRWEAKLPGNFATISWDAIIVNDNPGKVIGWRSVAGSGIDNAGKVEFMDAPDGKGTIIQAVISYLPPSGGYMKSKIAGFMSPIFEEIVRNDINNFKRFIENPTYSNRLSETQSFGETEI